MSRVPHGSDPSDGLLPTGIGAVTLLRDNVICVIGTCNQDHSPHVSAAHFAMDDEGVGLYMSLHARSQTWSNLVADGRAAITVGVDAALPATLQMRGHAAALDAARVEDAHRNYYTRFPYSRRYQDDPCTRFVHFVPSWSRYSDVDSRAEFFARGFAPESHSEGGDRS
jgi:uncharacterized protein YhbP (UPF0306 family)